jgi:hypothetical protein
VRDEVGLSGDVAPGAVVGLSGDVVLGVVGSGSGSGEGVVVPVDVPGEVDKPHRAPLELIEFP